MEVIKTIQAVTDLDMDKNAKDSILRSLAIILKRFSNETATATRPSLQARSDTVISSSTYAAAISRHKPEDRKKVSEELQKMRYVPPTTAQNRSQSAFDLRQITVRGMAERKISEMKTSFYNLHIC